LLVIVAFGKVAALASVATNALDTAVAIAVLLIILLDIVSPRIGYVLLYLLVSIPLIDNHEYKTLTFTGSTTLLHLSYKKTRAAIKKTQNIDLHKIKDKDTL
jgi:hypothetical protein